MFVAGKIADTNAANVYQTRLGRPPDDARGEKRFTHLRKKGQNIYPHQPVSLLPGGVSLRKDPMLLQKPAYGVTRLRPDAQPVLNAVTSEGNLFVRRRIDWVIHAELFEHFAVTRPTRVDRCHAVRGAMPAT
jgi:hypothetical protein